MKTPRVQGMFKSARLKLTLFYLAVILVFSLSVTAAIRVFAEREFDQSNIAQRDVVRRLVRVYPFSNRPPEVVFTDAQDDQAALVRQHLNEDLVLINVVALVFGGLLSYWFAGRTLRPIEEAHDAQKRFAADASHELRTPLTNMQLENEVFLRQKDFSEAEARAQLKSNLEEVQRLENLSSSLLALAQYEQTALEMAKIPVQRIVKDATTHLQKTADAKRVKFAKSLQPAAILGHEESLVQLVEILLDNAVKYGPERGVVTVRGKVESGRYSLTVSDEGPGILPADMPFIFDRLYRGDKARSSKTGGYGLGLALAKQIAEANGVHLEASNSPEKGAVFALQMPLTK